MLKLQQNFMIFLFLYCPPSWFARRPKDFIGLTLKTFAKYEDLSVMILLMHWFFRCFSSLVCTKNWLISLISFVDLSWRWLLNMSWKILENFINGLKTYLHNFILCIKLTQVIQVAPTYDCSQTIVFAIKVFRVYLTDANKLYIPTNQISGQR